MKSIFNSKRASTLYQYLIQIILVGLIFAMFFYSATSRVNSNNTKQQVLEKQIALFIESGEPNMTFTIAKANKYGAIKSLALEFGRVKIFVNDLKESKGYPYFTKYDVSIDSNENYYYVRIK
jgi:hypothetical protein